MPYNSQFDLRGKKIEDTFTQVLQYNTSSGNSYTGLGEQIFISSSFSQTASFAMNGGGGGGTSLTSGSYYNITTSYSDTSSVVPFNGNRTIKRSGYTGINVGGDNVDTFLNNFFFPFVPSTVTVSGTSTYQTGTLQSPIILSSITQNDETSFGSASVFKDSTLWNTDSTIPPYSFAYTDVNISSNHSYQTLVQVNNNGSPTIISSNTIQASFIYPYLWGMSSTAGLTGNGLYTTFTRQVVTQGNKTVSLVGNVVYIYFCYPATYPDLTSILDPNLFEIINSFDYSGSVSVTSSGLSNNWTTTYKVYRTTLVADPNGNFQFKY